MSLCILLRTPDGGAMMAADTAVSTVYEGQPYRVTNEEDHEKIIIHLGHMIFCSGNLERCRVLRQFICTLDNMDYEAISSFAKSLWGDNTTDDSTGLLVCQPDNKLVGMLSAQSFEVTELPQNQGGLDIQALGFKMNEAYVAACASAQQSDDWRAPIMNAYSSVVCEEVGGNIHVFTRNRADTDIKAMTVPMSEPSNIRRGVFVVLSQPFVLRHAIVQAKQFLDSKGKDMFTDKGKISGEYLDLRGVNIVNSAGDTMITIDETGIHWAPKYSPFKTQYSVSANGPWHDTYAANDEYRRESNDGGITWGPGIKYVAKDGRPGSNGSDANVDYANIKAALQKAASIPTAFMSVDEMGAPKIFGGEIYGAKIYAGHSGGVGTGSIISLTDDGIKMYNESNNTNLEITSKSIPGVGTATALYGGNGILLLNAQNTMIGNHIGTPGAVGIQVSPSETIFYGTADFSRAEVTGVPVRFG